MNAKQAMAEARRRWGKDAGIQDRGPKHASTPEKREAAYARARELRPLVDSMPPGEERKAKRAELDKARSEGSRFRYSVGHIALGGLFFAVHGQGDSWKAAYAQGDERDRDMFARIAKERKQKKRA